jgi:hypothetical protein
MRRPTPRTTLWTSAAGLLLSLAVASCTAGGATTSPTPTVEPDATVSPTPSPTIAPEIDTPASELRAAVGSLLHGHVYLLALTTGVVLREGSESEELVRTQRTLDDNTAALAEVLAANYGEPVSGRFMDLWRAHVGYVTDFARAVRTGDVNLREQMRQQLDELRPHLASFLQEMTDGVIGTETGTAVLEPIFTAELRIVEAQAAAASEVPRLLRRTADRTIELADLIAGAIVVQDPETYGPSIDTPAAGLRLRLQTLLQEHTYLLWLAVDAGLRGGSGSPGYVAATSALDATTQAIAAVWGEQAGPASQEALRELLRGYTDVMVAYGISAGSLDDLETFRETLAVLLEQDTGGILSRQTVEDELDQHVGAVIEALDARRSDTRRQSDLLRDAARQMALFGDALASAMVQRFPDSFASPPP